MLQKVRDSFQPKADPVLIIDRASAYASELQYLMVTAKNLVSMLEGGAMGCSTEISRFIDKAEAMNLVSREGMKKSGMFYVLNEGRMTKKMIGITAAEALNDVKHVTGRIQRAHNIVNLNHPNGYKPRQSAGLYHLSGIHWEALIP